jgi:hypothetical protein
MWDTYAKVKEGIEALIEMMPPLLAKCFVMEHLYIEPHRGAASGPSVMKRVYVELEEVIREVYHDVIKGMTGIWRFCQASKRKRITNSLTKVDQSLAIIAKLRRSEHRIDNVMQTLLHDQVACHMAATRQNHAEYQRMLEAIRAPLDAIETQVSKALKKICDGTETEIMEWLSAIMHGDVHESISRDRVLGTCDWLMGEETFLDWKSAEGSSTFWLLGESESPNILGHGTWEVGLALTA